jgi:hypothetical protein
MTCLNDIQIQALADGEADFGLARHVSECAACAARLRDREHTMAVIRHTLDVPIAVPAHVARSVDESLRSPSTLLRPGEAGAASSQAAASYGGGTRLRSDLRGVQQNPSAWPGRRQSPGTRGWIYSGLAVAAATLIAVLFITPIVKRPDATVSASEILAKSASRLSATVTSGVEMLEYELVLDGVPKEILPDQVDGTYKVRQVIDHNVPGRFRFSSYAPDGQMLTSIAQDPLGKRRVMAFISEGQPYRFDVTLTDASPGMSLPELEQLHMQASITMMQASGNQLLETIDGPNGKLYRIEVPRLSGPGTNPVWDLSEARVLIDAGDYHVIEFAVRGTFLKQSYSMSYKVISHVVAASVKPEVFEVPSQPGEIVITGEGTSVPPHDLMVLALRELTKLKQAR